MTATQQNLTNLLRYAEEILKISERIISDLAKDAVLTIHEQDVRGLEGVTIDLNDGSWVRFARLREEWQRDTLLTSSVTEMIAHPAYLGIIGMGQIAVPLILEDLLKNEPDQWAPALTAITGADPVPAESYGDMQAIAEAWLRWGRLHGHLR